MIKTNLKQKKSIKKTSKKSTAISKKQLPKLILKIFLLLFWVAVSIIASQFILYFIMQLFLSADQLSEPLWTAIYNALVYILALLLIVFVPWKIFKKWRTNREEIGLKGTPTWIDIGLAPAGLIVYFIIAAIITAIFSMFPWFDASQAQDVGFNSLFTISDRLIAFIALVVVAPIAEEIIFRGWLYGKLREHIPGKISSIIISALLVSVLFGLLHGQWNVGVNVFALSLVLCALREVTGTIYSGILLHMIKNGIAFYMLYVLNMV